MEYPKTMKTYKWHNIHVMGILEEVERDKGTEELFQTLITDTKS